MYTAIKARALTSLHEKGVQPRLLSIALTKTVRTCCPSVPAMSLSSTATYGMRFCVRATTPLTVLAPTAPPARTPNLAPERATIYFESKS